MLGPIAEGCVCLVVSHLASFPTGSVAGCRLILKRPVLTPGGVASYWGSGRSPIRGPVLCIPVQPLTNRTPTSGLFRSASAPKLFPVGRHGCPTQGGDCDRRDQTPSPSEIAAAASGEGGAGNPASATQRVCVTGVWRELALEKLAAHGGSHGPTSSETMCGNDTVQVIRSFLQWLRDISSWLAAGREIPRQDIHADSLRWPLSSDARQHTTVIIPFCASIALAASLGTSFACIK